MQATCLDSDVSACVPSLKGWRKVQVPLIPPVNSVVRLVYILMGPVRQNIMASANVIIAHYDTYDLCLRNYRRHPSTAL